VSSADRNAGPGGKLAALGAALQAANDYRSEDTRISITPGLAGWMLANRVSLAFTSYQTGQLILAGVGPDGRVSFDEQNYARATGLCFADGELHVASMFQVWRLANMLKPGQYARNAYDALFVPRSARTVNFVDTHEMAVDGHGKVIFVASRYSCLATFDDRFSFRPIWKPPFITALAPEDRCHLNGLAIADGVPAYVTAFSVTDASEGWRPTRTDGGIVMDVASGEVVAHGLSLPHSPRVHDGHLWVLNSGRGQIVRIDQRTGQGEPVVFCPGFLRGLSFVGRYALVTASKSRGGRSEELALGTELARRGEQEMCAVLIVDLERGEVVESIQFDGKITELFDVAIIPDVRNPMSLGPQTVEMIGNVSISDDWATLG
jgi:uncharacterized protein (TIGR03032 family)